MAGSLIARHAGSVRGRFGAGRRHVKFRAGCRGPPLARIAAASSRRAAQPGDPGFDGQSALGLVGLGAVGHVPRSRRTCEAVAVAAIVVGALRRIGQDNRASTFERLAAWNKRQAQRLERKAERQARRLAVWAKLRIRRPRAGQRTAG